MEKKMPPKGQFFEPGPRPIGEEWDRYVAWVLDPIDAGAAQRQETRRAFYAGASVVAGILSRIGQPDVSAEEGVLILQQIKAEIQVFLRTVGTPMEKHP